MRPYFETGAYGWKLVAVGNGLTDIVDTHLQFAYRSVDPKDFVAVANSTGTPKNCPSNTFDDDPSAHIMGLAFSGDINGSLCGTSFSTPRVAWLLAAREVIRGKKVPKGDERALSKWITSKADLVQSLQNSSSDFFGRYAVDVDKLIAP